MGFLTQPYVGAPLGSRLVFIGGYGGWLDDDERFDGLRSRADIWTTVDGRNWTLITPSSELGELAWMGTAVFEPQKMNPPRMWVVGGGYIGDNGNKRVGSMVATSSVYWSQEGKYWTRVNFVSGGGKTSLAVRCCCGFVLPRL
jgi:hypothetical protein